MKKRSKYGDKTFRDLKCGKVEYDGKDYSVWDVEVRPHETVLFADVRLLSAIEENGEAGCSLDDKVAYYADPDEKVADAVEQYLE